MDKQQLRRCFDRIKPSEALIRTTCNRIEEARKDKTAMSQRRSYGFAYRLATTACALLLVVGVGVTLGKDAAHNPNTAQSQDIDRVVPFNADGNQESPATSSNEPQTAICTAMIERARAQGDEWLVITAYLDAVSTKQNESKDGFDYTVMVSSQQIVASDPNGSFIFSDDEACSLTENIAADTIMNAVGSRVHLRLRAEQQAGKTVWTVQEFALAEADGEKQD